MVFLERTVLSTRLKRRTESQKLAQEALAIEAEEALLDDDPLQLFGRERRPRRSWGRA